ncbi:hypothetical protein V6N11_060303 [Hibiscus sabdariffa]|uniref:Uncharacterized protein n=1 Tax=Hibiscus sabdariffa TaxID=183260 RepID=A0ABR2QQ84_9ROSI
MVSRKTRIREFETVAATEACLAMMHNKVPAKKTDPGSFTIPCSIGNNYSCKSLCDLGASINLMPKSVFKKLGIGEAKPTTVILQLADRSCVQPEGKIEDILVRVDKFIFPADFLILDCEADEHAPVILGRSFLATSRVLLDFENNELVLRVNEQKSKTIQKKPDQVNSETGNWAEHNSGKYFESLNYSNKDSKTDKPSVEQPQNLELKPLPEQLKYAYLGDDNTLPVIISSKLLSKQEKQLIQMLWQHKRALGWTIADIKGINPTIFMHKILLEDNYKPTVDAQRRINQAMKDVGLAATLLLVKKLADFFIFWEEFPDFCSLVYSGGLRRDLFVNSWRLKIQVHRVTKKSNGCRFLRLDPRFTFYRLSEEQVFEPEVVD